MRRPKRILLVEDNKSWREWVRTRLAAHPQLQVISEAVDGLEAIEKASQFRPDLILMDVSLPHVNGIESANQILQMGLVLRLSF